MGRPEFSAWLRNKLRSEGMSQADLARLLDVDTGQVSRWVRGERLPRADSLDRLADVLHTSYDLLLSLAGVRPDEDEEDDPVKADLIGMLARVRLNRERERQLRSMLRIMIEEDESGYVAGTNNPSDAAPARPVPVGS